MLIKKFIVLKILFMIIYFLFTKQDNSFMIILSIIEIMNLIALKKYFKNLWNIFTIFIYIHVSAIYIILLLIDQMKFSIYNLVNSIVKYWSFTEVFLYLIKVTLYVTYFYYFVIYYIHIPY